MRSLSIIKAVDGKSGGVYYGESVVEAVIGERIVVPGAEYIAAERELLARQPQLG